MRLMMHPDPDVQKEALLCVQKILLSKDKVRSAAAARAAPAAALEGSALLPTEARRPVMKRGRQHWLGTDSWLHIRAGGLSPKPLRSLMGGEALVHVGTESQEMDARRGR